MTPKQRFLTALKGGIPDDKIARMELEFHLFKEFLGKEPICGEEYAKLSKKEKDIALNENAQMIVEINQICGLDAIREIGGYWEVAPGVGAYLWLPEEEDQINQLKAIKKAAGDEYAIIGTGGGTMSLPDGNSINDFVIDLFEEPEKIHAQNERMLTDNAIHEQKLVEAGLVDAIINCGDVAFNSGPFISPDMMDEFFFPYFNRWVERVHSFGVPAIWHTDGNIMPLMDRVLQSGVDAIQCIDPLASMDIVELIKQVEGKLTLIGNLDCSVLQFGPEGDIDALAKRIIENCKDKKGFIFSCCNVIFKGIPKHHYQSLINAVEKYGSI
ncbi:MAG: hypothetical protein IJF54_06380 [Clostridia bacterium]|nr:hypothetical protein [Clostridia bacterium]